MKRPVRIAVTGAAGSINYSLLFKIAAGEMFGKDQPVILQLVEVPAAMDKLLGVAMELEDCAFPLLHSITLHNNPQSGFKGVHYALLIGAKPRGPGMERKDLLKDNAKIFAEQGRALNDFANRDVKVLVVGNPANTNALIASRNAPDLSPSQFTAMTRLDHNRAKGILANKTHVNAKDISRVIIWGNHSTTQYPDLHHTRFYDEEAAIDQIDRTWYTEEFIPKVQKRGAAVIEARGQSSAASAAQAVVDHMRDWVMGTPANDYVSMAIISDGSYGIEPGIMYSFPVRCDYGRYQIVQGLEINEFSRQRMKETEQELLEEREAVKDLLPKETEASHESLSIALRSVPVFDDSTVEEFLQTDRVR